MPAVAAPPRRRTRRIVEYGGWADLSSYNGRRPKLLGNGSLLLRRRKERARENGPRLKYIGIDPGAEPSRSIIRNEKGERRVVFEWRQGSYMEPANVRPASIDEIHFHMINDGKLTPKEVPQLIQNINRILRTGGRLYVTMDNKMIGDTAKKRTIYLHEIVHQFYRSRLFRVRFVSISPNSIPQETYAEGKNGIAPRLTPDHYWFKVRGFRAFKTPARVEKKFTQFNGNTEVMAILTKRKRPSNP